MLNTFFIHLIIHGIDNIIAALYTLCIVILPLFTVNSDRIRRRILGCSPQIDISKQRIQGILCETTVVVSIITIVGHTIILDCLKVINQETQNSLGSRLGNRVCRTNTGIIRFNDKRYIAEGSYKIEVSQRTHSYQLCLDRQPVGLSKTVISGKDLRTLG